MQELAAPWPEYKTLLAVDRTRLLNFGRRVRLAFAIRKTRPLRAVIDRTVQRCPWLRPALDGHPILFRPLLSVFLDARFDARQSFAHYAHDLEFVSTRIRRAIPWFFPAALSAPLWADRERGYTAELSMNLAHPQEGLWQLTLCDGAGERLFCVCFSVLPGPRLFVGAVQGGRSGESVDVGALIRAATKDFEGMRPHFLLFELLRTLAAAWGIGAITGIANRHQLKTNSKRDGRRLMHFSYDTFFQELGAARTACGNWDVPAAAARRDLADVPSRKRAMYRRRHALLDALRAQALARLAGPPLET